VELVYWFLVGYIFGSFPTGYVLGRLKGKDIRKLGSGNIGGANVYRVLGPKYALLTIIGDVLKGFIPVILAPNLFLSVAAAMGALSGSIFSLFLRFRGGKGFATLTGTWLALMSITSHWEIFFVLLVPWVTTTVLSKYTSLANLVTVSTSVPVSALTGNPLLLSYAAFSAVMIYYSHRENVARLLEGREHSFLEKVTDQRW